MPLLGVVLGLRGNSDAHAPQWNPQKPPNVRLGKKSSILTGNRPLNKKKPVLDLCK